VVFTFGWFGDCHEEALNRVSIRTFEYARESRQCRASEEEILLKVIDELLSNRRQIGFY